MPTAQPSMYTRAFGMLYLPHNLHVHVCVDGWEANHELAIHAARCACKFCEQVICSGVFALDDVALHSFF